MFEFQRANRTTGFQSLTATSPQPNLIQGTWAGKITEIIMQDEAEYNFQLLMPLLAQLSKDDRWFAWIAPPLKLPKDWLREAGIDLNKIMLLQPDQDHSTFELAQRALSTGTCHAVISWPQALSNDQFSMLKTAAEAGRSHAILIRPR